MPDRPTFLATDFPEGVLREPVRHLSLCGAEGVGLLDYAEAAVLLLSGLANCGWTIRQPADGIHTEDMKTTTPYKSDIGFAELEEVHRYASLNRKSRLY